MFWDNTQRLTNELRGRGSLEVRTEQHLWRVTFHGDMGELGGEFRLSRRRKRARVAEDWPQTFPADPQGMRQVVDTLEEAEIQAGGDPRRWQIYFPAAPDLDLSSWTAPWQFDENHALARLFEEIEEDDEEEE